MRKRCVVRPFLFHRPPSAKGKKKKNRETYASPPQKMTKTALQATRKGSSKKMLITSTAKLVCSHWDVALPASRGPPPPPAGSSAGPGAIESAMLPRSAGELYGGVGVNKKGLRVERLLLGSGLLRKYG